MSDKHYVTVLVDGKYTAMEEEEARNRGLYPRISDDAARLEIMEAHVENLIERVAELEERLGYGVSEKTMWPCPRRCHDGAKVDEDTGLLVPCSECDGLGKIWIEPWHWSKHTGDMADDYS